VNVSGADVPPPGPGFETVTETLPGLAILEAGTIAVSWDALTYVVVSAELFQSTLELATKLEPFTVRVNCAPRAATLVGVSDAEPGAGLSMLKVRPGEDVPPPGAGFATVTVAVPATAMSDAAMAAVSWVALTSVVVRVDPFHKTVEPLTKPVPLTVSVNPAPATMALGGERLVVDGTGLSIVNPSEFETPPGIVTLICAVPAAVKSRAGTMAVSSELPAYVVARFAPFHCTIPADVNGPPSTASRKAAPPTTAEEGCRLPRDGTVVPVCTTDTGCVPMVNVANLSAAPLLAATT